MMGKRYGVATILKRDCPWLLTVWYLAHRLELAVKDTFNGTYMDTILDVLTSVYYFYRGSSKRNREAAELADIMDEQFLKPAKANGTRWVEHKLLAVSKMLRNWPVIVAHMENYAEDVSNKAEDRAKARGIIRKLKQFKFVNFLYFVKDVLSELSCISLLFQREDINVTSAVTRLQTASVTLNEMVTNPGINLFQFDVDVRNGEFHNEKLQNVVDNHLDAFNRERQQILQGIIHCLDSRFNHLNEDPIFQAAFIFDHKNWPDLNAGNALVQYGVAEIRLLVNHVGPLLVGLDVAAVLREWTDLKAHICRNDHFRECHPHILKVIHLVSLFPLSNASCERGFSTMKRIKSDWRCRLSNETLNTLMRIDMCGPDGIGEFQPRGAVNRWWLSSQRIRRTNILPYGPHQ